MTRLADLLSVDDVRQAHLDIFNDLGAEYLRAGPFGIDDRERTRRRIINVKNRKIRRNLEAIPPFDAATVSRAWSHHMAVWTGTHLWPDANHRTADAIFLLASHRAFGLHLIMSGEAAERMVRSSKAIRDADFLARGRYYDVDELADPKHPYRRLYASFEPELERVGL